MERRGRVGVTADGEAVGVVESVDGERVLTTRPLSGSTMFLYRDPASSTSRFHVASSVDDDGAVSASSNRSAAFSSPVSPTSSTTTTSASTVRSEPTRTGCG